MSAEWLLVFFHCDDGTFLFRWRQMHDIICSFNNTKEIVYVKEALQLLIRHELLASKHMCFQKFKFRIYIENRRGKLTMNIDGAESGKNSLAFDSQSKSRWVPGIEVKSKSSAFAFRHWLPLMWLLWSSVWTRQDKCKMTGNTLGPAAPVKNGLVPLFFWYGLVPYIA